MGAGSRHWGSGGKQSQATIPSTKRESKPNFLSPNSFSTMAEITFHYESRCRDTKVMRHNTNSRTVIQVTKKCTTLSLQCVYAHTHTHTHTRRSQLIIGGPNSLGRQGRERGDNLAPYDEALFYLSHLLQANTIIQSDMDTWVIVGIALPCK